jgi:long-chain acyl-CoA synthetase
MLSYSKPRTDKPKVPGFSHEYISNDTDYLIRRGGNVEDLEADPFNGVDTLIKALKRNVELIPHNNLLGTRVGDKYEWMTFSQTADVCEHLSHGLMALDLAPKVRSEDKDWRFIGIQSKNRKEWNLTSVANMYQKITTIALYDTLGVDALRYILNQTKLITMVVSNDFVEKLVKIKVNDNLEDEPKMFRLKNIISFESVSDAQKDLCKAAGVELHTFDEVLAAGRKAAKEGKASLQEPTKEDVFMLSYTSGTTGDPKGVKISHKMIVQVAFAFNVRMGLDSIPLNEDDSYISYLPAAHVFE